MRENLGKLMGLWGLAGGFLLLPALAPREFFDPTAKQQLLDLPSKPCPTRDKSPSSADHFSSRNAIWAFANLLREAQRNRTRQRLSNSSTVFGRRAPSRLLSRSWEIARSCSGIAKLRSFRPPSDAGTSRWSGLPKSVRVSGTARERPRFARFSWSTETMAKGRGLACSVPRVGSGSVQ